MEYDINPKVIHPAQGKHKKKKRMNKITLKHPYKGAGADTSRDNKNQKTADLFSLCQRGYTDQKPHFWRCGCYFLSILPKHKQAKLTWRINEKIVAYPPTEKTDKNVHQSRLKGWNQYRANATKKTTYCQIYHMLGSSSNKHQTSIAMIMINSNLNRLERSSLWIFHIYILFNIHKHSTFSIHDESYSIWLP